MIFGTGDFLGLETFSGDAQFQRALAGQGVYPDVFIHAPGNFKGW
jgi:hypothetical protein